MRQRGKIERVINALKKVVDRNEIRDAGTNIDKMVDVLIKNDIKRNSDLAKRIFDCVSNGYDDEEYREETETRLSNELSQLSDDSYLKDTITYLCERIENLETELSVEVTIYKDTVTLKPEEDNLIEIKISETCIRRYVTEICHADYDEWINTYTADDTEDLFNFVVLNDYKYRFRGV